MLPLTTFIPSSTPLATFSLPFSSFCIHLHVPLPPSIGLLPSLQVSVPTRRVPTPRSVRLRGNLPTLVYHVRRFPALASITLASFQSVLKRPALTWSLGDIRPT